MADFDAQERTELPTARRLKKAREEGQVARSTELPAALIVIGAMAMFAATGGWIAERIGALLSGGLQFDAKVLQTPRLMTTYLSGQLLDAFGIVLPLLLLAAVLATVGSGITGGYLLSVKAIAFNHDRLNPLSGLKRMFGMHALVEVTKSILKFTIVTAILWASIASQAALLNQIGSAPLEPALSVLGKAISQAAVWVALGLALIALVDVPYQRYQYMKKMRMTKQEVRDELKDMEGRPEVKAQIRRRQREMANKRMMQKVKDADVVITNPEHFAVALEYDVGGSGAPVLIAKGTDHMARRIREEAASHGVHVIRSPELARALYFSTELDHPIPEPLYRPVAEIIAYVFNLEASQPGRAAPHPPNPVVPSSMQFDADGRLKATAH